jgi:hypothetical protein
MGKALSGLTDAIGLTDTHATDRAVEEQRRGRDISNKIMNDMYAENKTRHSPYIDQGYKSFTELVNLPVFKEDYERFSNVDSPYRNHSGTFTQDEIKMDPGYQFRLDEGLKAIERARASKGLLNSGATLKDLVRYSQDYASNEFGKAYDRKRTDYNDAFNRFNYDRDSGFNRRLGNYQRERNHLSELANIGRDSVTALGGLGTNYASQSAKNAIGFSNAMASAELNRNNDMKNLMGKAADFGTLWGASKLGL